MQKAHMNNTTLNDLLYSNFYLPTAQQSLIRWVNENPLDLSDKELQQVGENQEIVNNIVHEIVQYIAHHVKLHSTFTEGFMIFEEDVLFNTALSQLILYVVEQLEEEKSEESAPTEEIKNRFKEL
jgi:hypothetical protein